MLCRHSPWQGALQRRTAPEFVPGDSVSEGGNMSDANAQRSSFPAPHPHNASHTLQANVKGGAAVAGSQIQPAFSTDHMGRRRRLFL